MDGAGGCLAGGSCWFIPHLARDEGRAFRSPAVDNAHYQQQGGIGLGMGF